MGVLRVTLKGFFLAILAVSCNSMTDSPAEKPDGPEAVFYAGAESLQRASQKTKTFADENFSVLWNADDRISIFNKNTANRQYKFTGKDGDNAGNFEVVAESGSITSEAVSSVYAVYPYYESTQISKDGIVKLSLPQEQTYGTNSFGRGANTMIAITDGNFLSFKNVGGYLALKLYGDDVTVSKITLQGNKSEKIAGNAEITIKVGETPQVVMEESSTDLITLVCDPPVQLAAGNGNYTYFWFVVPPTAFSEGFAITVTNDQGKTYSKSTSNPLTVLRNYISTMAPLRIPSSFVSGDDSTEGTEIVDIIDGIW